MKPYYQHAGITIYHGDCREVWPSIIAPCDVVLTDPPYGISGALNSLMSGRSKGCYDTDLFEDNDIFVDQVAVPMIEELRRSVPVVVLTPGQINIYKYKKPDHMGVFYYPASTSCSRWGMRLWQPILYYGKDPHQGKLKPDSMVGYDSDRLTPHPCPKPLKQWSWLLQRCTKPGDRVLDPFLGGGATLVCAKRAGLTALGIEIEERYCEIAAKRLSQEVLPFTDLFGTAMRDADEAAEQYLIDLEAQPPR